MLVYSFVLLRAFVSLWLFRHATGGGERRTELFVGS